MFKSIPVSTKKDDECCGGRCCPYGCSYAGPMIATVIAVIFTIGAPWSCTYFRVEYYENGIFYDADAPSKFSVGPWSVEDFNMTRGAIDETGSCTTWSNHQVFDTGDLDGSLRWARFFLMLMAILAYSTTTLFCFGSCCLFQPRALKAIAFSFMAFGVMTLLSLVSLSSDWCKDANSCKIDAGGVFAILMFFAWAIAGATIFTMREKPQFANNNNSNSSAAAGPEETTTEDQHTLVEADGTVVKVTTKRTRRADGTQTATETRQVVLPGGGVAGGAMPVAAAPPTVNVNGEEEEFSVAVNKPDHQVV